MVNNPVAKIIGKRYKLQEPLGRGGMGIVYQAEDILTGNSVALKQVTIPTSQLLSASTGESSALDLALAQEFRALAALRHPHIISVYDFGFDQNRQPFFTMEYVASGQTILEAGQMASLADKIQLVTQMLQALVYLHRRGILHRDLKPTNALVSQGQLKVLDFGLSVITSQTREHLTTTTAGTMAYIAPEIFQGEPYSRASDLYAVGLITFQLLTGHYPYNESNMATMLHDILSKEVDASLFGISDSLAVVLNRLLAKERTVRYQNAEQVISELSAAAGLPPPPESVEIRESFLESAKFVGRDKELSQLTKRLKQATGGQGGIMLIGGESGVGKSRLLDELRIIALVQGLLVLSGQAVSDGRRLYELWRGVLPTLILFSDPDDEAAALLKSLVPQMDRLVKRSVSRKSPADPQETQEQLAHTISSLLKKLPQPVVIILEDMQWAGAESIQLLNELAGDLHDQPTLLLGTYRDDEPLQFLEDLTSGEFLTLQRLTKQDIAELSASMIGQVGREPALVELLQQETEGNALFLVEAVRALAEEAGQLDSINVVDLPENIVTGGIRAILDRRLSRVPEDAFPLVQLASVAGRQLDLTVLQLLEPEVDLDGWLATCTEVAVLEPHAKTWRFSHDKLREQIRDTLSHELHHELHWRVALALETAYPDDPEQAAVLAHHWAVAGDQNKELYYSEVAGYQAIRDGANTEAIRLLQRTLELLLAQPQSPERDQHELELLIALGPLLFTTLGYDAPEVEKTYAKARELALRIEEIDLLFHATWGQWMHYLVVDLDFAQELVRQLFQLAELSQDDSLLLEAHHSGWSTEWSQGDAAAAYQHTKHGLEIYDPGLHGDHVRFYGHDPGVCARQNAGTSLWLLGYPDQAQEGVHEAVVIAEEIGHPYSLANAYWSQALIRYLRGEYQEALAQAKKLRTFSQEQDFSSLMIGAEWFIAASLVGTNHELEGLARLRNLFEASSSKKRYASWSVNLSNYLRACLSTGSLEEGFQTYERAAKYLTLQGSRVFDSEIRRLHGELLLAQDAGHVSEAESEFQVAIEIARQQGAKSLELRAVTSLARLWQQTGQRERAQELLAACYGWFGEGFDTADLVAAQELLQELA